MAEKEHSLLECEPGTSYRLLRFAGGPLFEQRLTNMGLRPGKVITKLHSHLFGGPVTIMIDSTHLAIGKSMAKRIVVEPCA